MARTKAKKVGRPKGSTNKKQGKAIAGFIKNMAMHLLMDRIATLEKQNTALREALLSQQD